MSTHHNKINALLFNVVNDFNRGYPGFNYSFKRKIEFFSNLVKILSYLSFNISFNCHQVFRGEEGFVRGEIAKVWYDMNQVEL